MLGASRRITVCSLIGSGAMVRRQPAARLCCEAGLVAARLLSRMRRRHELTDAVRRHISAARAFHTGLLADTHQLKAGLHKLAKHLDVLRHQGPGVEEKLKAAEASCLHTKTLEKLHRAWRETHLDLRRSLRHVRYHFRHVAFSRGRRANRT
jgi:hypothetical protein